MLCGLLPGFPFALCFVSMSVIMRTEDDERQIALEDRARGREALFVFVKRIRSRESGQHPIHRLHRWAPTYPSDYPQEQRSHPRKVRKLQI